MDLTPNYTDVQVGSSRVRGGFELQDSEDGPQAKWVKEGIAHVETRPVSDLIIEEYDQEKVETYKEDFKTGSKFPLIRGYLENGKVHITAGHHRAAAWKALGHRDIPVLLPGKR